MSVRRATLHDILQRCDRLAQQGQRLRPGQQPIAAFDADGTLWSPDVADLLWDRLIAARALDRRAAAPIARALKGCGQEPARDPYRDFPVVRSLRREGRYPAGSFLRLMLQALAGLREDDVARHAVLAAAGSPELSTLGSSEVPVMLGKIRALGFRVIIVSGSPRWAVEAAAKPLGIEPPDILAGQVAVVDGVLTDGVLEPLPYGKGKVQAILKRYGAVPRVSAGNGLGDLPMMEATSDLRVLVDPTDELATAAEEIRGATWSMGLRDLVRPAGRSKAAVAQAGGAVLSRNRRPSAQT